MNIIKRLCIFATLAVASVTQLPAEQPAAPDYYQTLSYIRVPAAGRAAFDRLMKDVSIKTADARVKSGEIISWTLLRAVMPAGEEARADYVMSTIYDKLPPAPLDQAGNDALFKRAGVAMSHQDYISQRNKVSSLVTTEMWKPRARVGAPQVGHYLFINSMKVEDEKAYGEFELNVWRPLAEHLVKAGTLSGWIYATTILPEGPETPYTAYTSDMFPSWEAVFKNWGFDEAFAKVHPGKDVQQTFDGIGKMRSLARRELWVVTERVAK